MLTSSQVFVFLAPLSSYCMKEDIFGTSIMNKICTSGATLDLQKTNGVHAAINITLTINTMCLILLKHIIKVRSIR